MNEDAIRKAFEAERRKVWLGCSLQRSPGDGSYVHLSDRIMWDFWQAATRAAVPAWLPIESAPKDGSMFLVWVAAVRYGETDDGQQYQEDVSEAHFASWRSNPDGSGFVDCFSWPDCDSWGATHWMPLPAAPEAKP